MIIDQQNIGIYFLMTHMEQQSVSYFQYLLYSFFFQSFLLINSNSLRFDPWIFCYLPAKLFPSLWLFLVLFWMLRMLFTVQFWEKCYGNVFGCVQEISQILVTLMFKCWLKSFWLQISLHSRAPFKRKSIINKIIDKIQTQECQEIISVSRNTINNCLYMT